MKTGKIKRIQRRLQRKHDKPKMTKKETRRKIKKRKAEITKEKLH
jgi:hypothetical protein